MRTPEELFLDTLTRLDELMILNTEAIKSLDRVVKIALPQAKLTDMAELRRKVETGQWIPYEVKTIDLSTARTDELITIEGDFVHAWTDGVLDGIGVKYNNTNFGLIYFKRRNPISGFNFWKLFLSNTAQPGKTLDLMIGREASAQAFSAEITVSSSQYFYTLRSEKATHFSGAIAQNAKEDENLTGLLGNKVRITGIALLSKQNLSFRVLFWKTDGFEDPDLDLDKLCGEVLMDLPTYGYQIGGVNHYYLDMRGLEIDYIDEDVSNELHVSLQNLSAIAKDAIANAAVEGAVADDGTVLTDETSEANSAAASDMTLLPVAPVVNDAYYFGAKGAFDTLTINIGTQGVGTWTITWEYWNGATWVALAGVVDATNGFTAAVGSHDVTFTRPDDMARVAVGGISAFWIRARVSAYTGITTQPLGTQAWVSGSGEVALEIYYEPRA